MSIEFRSQHELWGWETLFQELSSFLRDADRHLGNATVNYAQYVVDRLEIIVRTIFHLKEHIEAEMTSIEERNRHIGVHYVQDMEDLLQCLRPLSQEWQKYLDIKERCSNVVAYHSPLEHTSQRGRPRFIVSCEQLLYLRSLSFTWTEIASLLGVSRMTIFRRRQEFGILNEPGIEVNDAELRVVLSQLRRTFPELGEKMVIGHLRSLGYNVTRSRVRNAIRVTDPINVALRWQGNLTVRRPYSVPGPNSLWHIGMCSTALLQVYVYICIYMHI